MKLSFSIRGWNDLSWEEIIDSVYEYEFCGIEVFNIHKKDRFLSQGGPFHKHSVAAMIRGLREKKLTISIFDTACDISNGDAIEKLKFNIDLASQTKTKYVSCLALNDNYELIKEGLSNILPYAEEKNVIVLIKTTGVFCETDNLRKLLDEYASDYLGAEWDIYGTYNDAHEEADVTINNLGAYIKYVQILDYNEEGFALIGEGLLPIEDIMDALYSVDYDGFISMIWKPKWLSELKDKDILMPYFVNYLNKFTAPRGKRRSLYPNHDGTGEYIWKKDELVDLTFSQVLDRLVEEFPDQYAFKYTTLDYTRTYKEFRDDVDRFARALIDLGVKAGSKVAIWATNVPEWFITFWATVKIGAVLVTVNTSYKIHEAQYLLRQSDTHTLVMVEGSRDANYASIIEEICPELNDIKEGEQLHAKNLPFLRNVITVGFRKKGCLTFEQANDRADKTSVKILRAMEKEVKSSDVCNMQYTSGTTGFPKGVMLTHYNVINNGKCIGDRMGLSTADRMMLQVPMFHCFGMVLSMTSSIMHGSTICPMPYFSAKASLACIDKEKITCFNGVPTMFIAMFNHPNYKKTDFSYMRTGIMAGSGCPAELMQRAARPDEMNMTGIVSVYGQTESSPGSTMSAWTDDIDLRCNTVGYNFPHIQCKIIDPETGEKLGPGENGEFCSKGYNTMKGYYKMLKATRDAIDKDGWLHSGDLACMNEDGTYKITGRLKDMIIRGGENLYPAEIEEFIYNHPDVKDVQVIGVPDEKYGEEAMACIILKEKDKVSEKEMRTFIEASLARHKVPRYIVFMDEFPMNGAGKILKYKMREDAAEKIKNNEL